jgi:fumarate reductase subunit C
MLLNKRRPPFGAEGRLQQTREPVFWIIKQAIGFRCFMLRGLEKVPLEWILVTLSYNLRRLHTLGAVLKAA